MPRMIISLARRLLGGSMVPRHFFRSFASQIAEGQTVRRNHRNSHSPKSSLQHLELVDLFKVKRRGPRFPRRFTLIRFEANEIRHCDTGPHAALPDMRCAGGRYPLSCSGAVRTFLPPPLLTSFGVYGGRAHSGPARRRLFAKQRAKVSDHLKEQEISLYITVPF